MKKEQKLYFYDWNAVEDEGLRFENFVASIFLKWVLFQQDTQGRKSRSSFLSRQDRTRNRLVIIEATKPIMFVECKFVGCASDKGFAVSKGLYKSVDAYQVHLSGKKEYVDENGIEVISVIKLLENLI